jgi:thioredoxin-like negative regulator of GroEL
MRQSTTRAPYRGQCDTIPDGMTGDSSELQPAVDGLIAEGRDALDAGDPEKALQVFSQIRKQRPERWEGHLGVAHALGMSDDILGALAATVDAIKADVRCLPAYELLAQIGMHGGVADTAIEWLEHGAQHFPEQIELFEWLVRLYAVAGHDNDLAQCLTHIARLTGTTVGEVAIAFGQDQRLTDDLRRRIAIAAGF